MQCVCSQGNCKQCLNWVCLYFTCRWRWPFSGTSKHWHYRWKPRTLWTPVRRGWQFLASSPGRLSPRARMSERCDRSLTLMKTSELLSSRGNGEVETCMRRIFNVFQAAQSVLISLFQLNTPEFSMLLAALPKTFQDGATKLLQNHLKNTGSVAQVRYARTPRTVCFWHVCDIAV